MSGHNKWAQIKRKKEVTDKKRGQIFTKLLRAISIAARTEPNPQFNPTLRSAIEKAKEYNVPVDNIDRAIKKTQDVAQMSDLLIEAYGPEGSALLITAQTDNTNRTVAQLKKIISDHNGKWADPGSVMWAFSKDGMSWKPTFEQPISPEGEQSLLNLLEGLDDHDDVNEIFTNVTLSELETDL